MDHSEDDRKLPSVPQQHQQGLANLQQQQQQQQQQPQQQQWSEGWLPQQQQQPGYMSQQILNPYQQQQQGQIPGVASVAAAAAGYPPAAESVLPSYQQRPQPQQQHQPFIYQQSYPGYAPGPPAQQHYSQQQMYFQQQQQQQQPQPPQPHAQQQPVVPVLGLQAHIPYQETVLQQQQPQPPPPPAHSFIQPKIGRLPTDRPLVKLSVSLIDTYKHINTVYYEERDARRAARSKEKGKVQGTNNNGWDDENYDYIVTQGELFYGRYKIRERIGKGSFGQVVRAEDIESKREVAIKIIKSKKPFLMQAKTEIELLTHLWEKDPEDQHNIVRLLTHFMYRNHQCIVFEMLSLNLYELLKNTQFGGVSLNLIRKFAKQVLTALCFLARSDVDIIHCDLKPENILLRHPKKSGVKVIDFGSSCRSNKRMYSYIQSRFYRSPEVMLGLPYSVAIDMWSLGCILAEMHTGEPLFSGSDQFDQMQKIVKLLGMVPDRMLDLAGDQTKLQFFEKVKSKGRDSWKLRLTKKPTKSDATSSTSSQQERPKQPTIPSTDPIASLTEVITAGSRQKKKFPPSEAHNSPRNYALFVDLVYKMLAYEPTERIKPEEALNHPFIVDQAAGSVPRP